MSSPLAKKDAPGLVAALISGDPEQVTAAKLAFAGARPTVTDAAAAAMARHLRARGPEARAVCEIYAAGDPPRVGDAAHVKLVLAFAKAAESRDLRELAQRASLVHSTHGRDGQYLKKLESERAARSSTSLLLRVLSVFKRPWVIVVFGLPAILAILFVVKDVAPALPVAIGFALFAVVVIAVDAFLRRCPECREPLAGQVVSIIREEHGLHEINFRCVFCKHQWQSTTA